MDISKNATGEAQFLQKACDGHQAREYQVLPLSSVADAGGNASDRQLVPNICTKRKVRKSNYSLFVRILGAEKLPSTSSILMQECCVISKSLSFQPITESLHLKNECI